MARVLYRLSVSEYVTDTSNHIYEAEQPINVSFRLQYGEKPNYSEKIYTQKEIAEMLDKGTFRQEFFFLFRDRCVFKKEWKVGFYYSSAFWDQKSIKISKVKEIKQQVRYIEKNQDDYTLVQLAKELSSTELLEYLKDHDVNIQNLKN